MEGIQDDRKKKRIVILGAKGVGKTSLINQFVNNNFMSKLQTTTNLILYKKVYHLCDNTEEDCYIELVDTPACDAVNKFEAIFSMFSTIQFKTKYEGFGLFAPSQVDCYIIVFEYISAYNEELRDDPLQQKPVGGKRNSVIFKTMKKRNTNIPQGDSVIDQHFDGILRLFLAIKEKDEKVPIYFVCNKYPHLFEDFDNEMTITQVNSLILKKYPNLSSIFKRLDKRSIDGQHIKTAAYRRVFFTDTKSNIGVSYLFKTIVSKLINNPICDSAKNTTQCGKQDETTNSSSEGGLFSFCCRKSKKAEEKVDTYEEEEEGDIEDSKAMRRVYRKSGNVGEDAYDMGNINGMNTRMARVKEEEEKSSGCWII